ncbi:MAG: rhomboid family intramembrane serine protease [candidate division Zixibacteria bacterium]|nr:rhomboid family intramembrane serine protease [candidate division Zixibacteria bacterium]
MMRQFQFRSRPRQGGLGFGPGALSPFIKVMLITNAVIFLIQYIYPQLTSILGLTPTRFFNEFPNLIYQPFTYMFLHGGFGHIFFNMFVLWMFGTEIEFTWGSRSFGRFYILSGLAGAILTLMINYSQPIPMIGASAAIYGLLVAYWLMFPNRLLYIYFLFPVKVKWAIPGMMILGFLFSGGNVAHLAHLGGAVFAFVYLKLDWRWLQFGQSLKGLRYRRQAAKQERNKQKASEVMGRIDDILDKINEVGFENISKSDKEFLKEASSQLSDKKLKD